jgi:hypothetical protein
MRAGWPGDGLLDGRGAAVLVVGLRVGVGVAVLVS